MTAPPSSQAAPIPIRRFLSLWGPVIAYMTAIHISSSMSNPPETGVSDKTLHMVAFGALALLTLRALASGTWRGVTRWTLIGCCVITLLYGVKDEWHQSFTPGRTPDHMDIVADFGGAVIAASAVRAWGIIKRL